MISVFDSKIQFTNFLNNSKLINDLYGNIFNFSLLLITIIILVIIFIIDIDNYSLIKITIYGFIILFINLLINNEIIKKKYIDRSSNMYNDFNRIMKEPVESKENDTLREIDELMN